MAHAALRSVLAGYLTRPPSEVTFVVNDWGKLSVQGGPYFSLAHSDDLAGC